jgi:gamma-glutamyltranspeptidase/glutathione hydrolase
MLVSDAPLATDVGVDVLRSGGNAVDAAVATAFALAVVYPEAGNIGGGGFMVAQMADGRTAALDFRETAPSAAWRDMFLDSSGRSTDRSLLGHLASGVPGTVAGLWEAHRSYGRLPWAALLMPAIRLANDGFIVDEHFAQIIHREDSTLTRFAGSAELFFSNGRPPAAGTHWSNPDLGATLERIASEGKAGFYTGPTASLIVAEMKRGGGLITAADLDSYAARWRDPILFTYRDHTVIAMPPPSSGGITLAIIAGIVAGFDLRALGWHSPTALHLSVEAMRRAFADRNSYLGDPDVVRIPQTLLLSREYADARRSTISLNQATPSSMVPAGTLERDHEKYHTTHISVVDAEGNAVSLTTTLNDLFGSRVTVRGAGFVLNDEMDDFSVNPGHPNDFGLVQGEANAVAPGKRMLSSMTPIIVLDENMKPLLVTGARGGPLIITSVFAVLSNVLDYRMEISAAVRAPRIHHQHLPDEIVYEKDGVDPATLTALVGMGHGVRESSLFGSAPSILRHGTAWEGIADPRKSGKAAGY